MTSEEEQKLQRLHEEFQKCVIKPEHTIREKTELFLKMEDGIKLRTIIYRTDREETAPTIVVRTCYPNNDVFYRMTAEEYCIRGYNYIYQYCRGTGGSEGVWEPNVNERADGKCTLDWIASQEWVGDMGYWGCSYLSLTGWVIADIVPDKVKTMYLTHYGTSRFVSVYQDGLFRHDVLTAWAMENAGYPVNADYLESCRYRPHYKVDKELWGQELPWYREWITNTSRSDEYWNTGFWKLLKEIPSRVKIPVYLGEGWFDHHLASAIETWKSLSEECRQKSCFRIGAWEHDFVVKLQDVEGTQFDNNDTLQAFYWFQNILVEKRQPESFIDCYVIGGDCWYRRKQYALENQKELRLYVGETEDGQYTLTMENSSHGGRMFWKYDPENPVMSHGAESLLHTKAEQGSLRQPDPGWRNDVVSCISEPLEKDVTVLGKMQAMLTVAADVEDTSFVAKIMEVRENGEAYNIRTGITTLGYRNQSDCRMEYEPGEKVQITIDTWDICWKFHKGSRIRVDFTSSDFPQYCIHSNYPGVWSQQDRVCTAVCQVYFGGYEESYLRLPLMPEPEETVL